MTPEATIRPAGRPPLPATALVLAGGRGCRMGENKLYTKVDGAFLLSRLLAKLAVCFSATLLCVGAGEAEQAAALLSPIPERFGASFAEDRAPGRGPLEGLRQGLAAMRTEWGFLLGVDMPALREDVVRAMWSSIPPGTEVAAPRIDGRLTALHAFYGKTCLPLVDAAQENAPKTARGGARIMSFYETARLHIVEEEIFSGLPDYRKSFENYNTKKELGDLLTHI